MKTHYKKQAELRFYEELNDFLPESKKKKNYIYYFNGRPSIKDAIESQNVPHIEVDLILVNGLPVGFDYQLKDEDRVAVYPIFESLDISSLKTANQHPLRNSKFVNDVHLGKLTRMMRMIGFDTYYRNNLEDEEIIKLSVIEKRIILTRDIGILKNKKVERGYFIRSQEPKTQLQEVIIRFQLQNNIRFLSRCISCNGEIIETDKNLIKSYLKPGTKKHFDEFFRCNDCGKIYWEGPHFNKMMNFYEDLREKINNSK